MKKHLNFMVLGLIATLLSACAGSTPEPKTYSIEMSEFAFSPNTIEAQVGQEVTIELINNGALEHEIMFGRHMVTMNNRPENFETDMFEIANVEPQVMQADMPDMGETGHGEAHTGFMVILPKSGDTASIKFKVTEDMLGEWEIACFSQEGVHYEAGMKGILVVKP